MTKQKLVRITRSFKYKMSLPNYENVDFFCEQSAEAPENEAEKTADALYDFCRKAVVKSVNKYIENLKNKFSANDPVILNLRKWLADGGDEKSDYGKPEKTNGETAASETLSTKL